MKVRKYAIISLLVFVLLVGLITVWWFLNGDAWIKGKIEETVSDLTGRSLSVEGAFSVDWSSKPILIAENVRLSNPSWALNPYLAKLDKLEVSVDLFSIFREPIRINYIVMDGLVIALEENQTGENSWDILPGQEASTATSEEPSEELPISIGRITLADFLLLHEAPDRTIPFDFHLEQLELTQRPDQQVQFTTDGGFGGESFKLAGNLGPLNELVAGGKVHHDIKLEMGEIILQSQGSFEQLSTLSGANIKLAFSGPEIEWILTQLALPQISQGSFDFKLDLQTAGGQTRVALDGNLGSLEANAQGSFTGLNDSGTADLTAEITGDDLGSLLEFAGVSGLQHKSFSLQVDVNHSPGLYGLQTLVLETGDNRVFVSGQLGDWPELKDTNLEFSLHGADLSAWSPILKMENIPASVFSLYGGVSTNIAGLGLDTVRLELGDSHFVVNGSLGELPEFTASQLNIVAAGPSLADFRFLPGLKEAPDLPFQVNGNVGMVDVGLTFDDLKLKLGDNSLQLSGLLGLNEKWEGSDLKTRMNLPDIAKLGLLFGMEGLPSEQLSMNGNFQRVADGWAFQLSNGNFASASFESDGTYKDRDERQIVEANSHLVAPNLAQLARMAGIDKLPEQPIDIKGFARYESGRIELRDIQGSLGDSLFNVTAKAVNPPSWSGSEITLSATGQDIGQLLVIRDFEGKLPFSLDGSVAMEEQTIRVSQVKAGLGLLRVSADGIVGKLDNLSDTDLQLEISAPSLQNIGKYIDFPLPDDPFRLSTRFQGSTSVFRADQLDLQLGSSDLSGEISVDLEGKPRIFGDLESNYLDLSWLQSADEEESTDDQPADTGNEGFLIPDTPIIFPRLDFADIDIKISVNKIDLQNQSMSDALLHSRVINGDLYLDPFQIRGEAGGLLSGKLKVEREDGSDIASIELALAGKEVKLGIGAVKGQDPDTIRKADIAINLSGAGATYQSFARSLNGYIEVVQGAGLTKRSGLGLLFGNFITELLNMLNPFATTNEFTVNECAVAIVNIESGLVTVEPVVSQTDKMTIIAEGVVDLHTEGIQFTFNTKLRTGIGLSASMVVNPFISITGTLLSPVVGLDPTAVIVEGTVAVATVGLSLLAKSLSDRFLSSKDPCGDALKKSREKRDASKKK